MSRSISEARLEFQLVRKVDLFGKASFFSQFWIYSSFVSALVVGVLRIMAEKEGVEGNFSGVKTVQSLNIHSMKIDMEKFNGTNNFGLWRCEVLDAFNT